jgi:DNA-binding NarL/FixJ family response regulator
MTEHIRVLLAGHHTLVREGIRQILEDEADIQIIAAAGNGIQAVNLAHKQRPDVASLDIRTPEMTGVEPTRRIKAQVPGVRVLVLTAHDDDPYAFALLQAGADGYVLKTGPTEKLLRTVHTVHAGSPALSPEIAGKVIWQVTSGRPAGAVEQVESLTEQELDVLRLAAHGMTNREIGHELGVNSRTEAATEALRIGWIVIE